MQLHGQSVLVLGLGESGLAMARWCAREGAAVRVADTRLEPPHRAALALLVPYAELTTGGLPIELLDGVDLVALSPGLAPGAPPQNALLDEAARRGIAICGELALFQAKLASLGSARGYAPVVLGVTGTNGKTTVTSLAGRLAARAGARVAVAGNIGPTTLDALSEALDADELPSLWVIEASSFQLEHAGDFAPSAAAFLNLTEDHLDWHGSMAAYGRAKARILERASTVVLNRDDAHVMRLAEAKAASATTFGLNAPPCADSFGVVELEGIRWLAYAQPDEPVPVSRRASKAAAAPATFTVKRLMPLDALQIRGDHNAANALAALALCHAAGLALAPLLHGLRGYRGEPHRVELVQSVGSVEYIDDSKGTNVGATVAALHGLGKRIVLIAGGDGKGQDFAPLAGPIARHARAVMLIGKDQARLRSALQAEAHAAGVELVDCASLEEAVECAASRAQPGDAVLLSPACASLDMFRNYKHRAEVFVAAVGRLAREARVAC